MDRNTDLLILLFDRVKSVEIRLREAVTLFELSLRIRNESDRERLLKYYKLLNTRLDEQQKLDLDAEIEELRKELDECFDPKANQIPAFDAPDHSIMHDRETRDADPSW